MMSSLLLSGTPVGVAGVVLPRRRLLIARSTPYQRGVVVASQDPPRESRMKIGTAADREAAVGGSKKTSTRKPPKNENSDTSWGRDTREIRRERDDDRSAWGQGGGGRRSRSAGPRGGRGGRGRGQGGRGGRGGGYQGGGGYGRRDSSSGEYGYEDNYRGGGGGYAPRRDRYSYDSKSGSNGGGYRDDRRRDDAGYDRGYDDRRRDAGYDRGYDERRGDAGYDRGYDDRRGDGGRYAQQRGGGGRGGGGGYDHGGGYRNRDGPYSGGRGRYQMEERYWYPTKAKKQGPFEKAGLSYPEQKLLNELGFEGPTPVQERAMPLFLKGKNVAIFAETGSGKTLAYGLPIMHELGRMHSQGSLGSAKPNRPRSVVLVPNVELCAQASGALELAAVACRPENGAEMEVRRLTGKDRKDKARSLAQRRAQAAGRRGQQDPWAPERMRGWRAEQSEDDEASAAALREETLKPVWVTTPGRLLALVRDRTVRLDRCLHLVLDEADDLLGGGSKEEVWEIVDAARSQARSGCQVVLAAATMGTDMWEGELEGGERLGGVERADTERLHRMPADLLQVLSRVVDDGPGKKERVLFRAIASHIEDVRAQRRHERDTMGGVNPEKERRRLARAAEEAEAKVAAEAAEAAEAEAEAAAAAAAADAEEGTEEENEEAEAEAEAGEEAGAAEAAPEEEEKEEEGGTVWEVVADAEADAGVGGTDDDDDEDESEASSSSSSPPASSADADEGGEAKEEAKAQAVDAGGDEGEGEDEDEDEAGAWDAVVDDGEGQAVVFTESPAEADHVAAYLASRGLAATAYHGKARDAGALDEVVSGERQVLVCTDLAARGLDFPHCNHVVQYSLPETLHIHLHRVGRTGRESQRGPFRSTVLVTKEQAEERPNIAKVLAQESKRSVMRKKLGQEQS